MSNLLATTTTTLLLLLLLLLTALAHACQRDWDALSRRIHQHAPSSKHHKRSPVPYPPVLTPTESVLVNSFDNTSLAKWSYYYTHGDHLGSHNKTMAEWTAQKWRDAGFDDAYLAEYPIWYTYPEHSRLRLMRPDGSVHEANLVEDVLVQDDTSGYPNLIPAYHAMSASGNVTAEYVYVGYVMSSLFYPASFVYVYLREFPLTRVWLVFVDVGLELISRLSRMQGLNWRGRLHWPCTGAFIGGPK